MVEVGHFHLEVGVIHPFRTRLFYLTYQLEIGGWIEAEGSGYRTALLNVLRIKMPFVLDGGSENQFKLLLTDFFVRNSILQAQAPGRRERLKPGPVAR
jgi:hypothetical protein